MKALVLAGTAFGSLAVGAIAAGWLMAVTPVPARSIQPSRTFVHEALASSVEAEAVTTTSLATAPPAVASPVPALAVLPSATTPKAIAPKKVLAKPRLAAKPPTIIAAVKSRLAKVAALVLPSRSVPKAVQPVDHRFDNVLTASQISRIKAGLRLSSDQEPYWPPVAAMLRAVGRRQMAAAKNGEAANFGSSGDLMQFYMTAQPLLRSLRDDQKAEVRRLAHRMGFGAVDSYI